MQRRILALFRSVEAEPALKEWRVGHMIQAPVTEGEDDLLWRHMRWAFSDLLFLMAFAGLCALSNA